MVHVCAAPDDVVEGPGLRAHGVLVDKVAARPARAARELRRLQIREAEDRLLPSRSMTTVLDLLG
ncbi:hypothetical protein [Streptomyces sp. SID12501]|uniref:Uncharacterized protein n=1 Tax=Streptomyces sp. SID12501 TaxID=2706042 RepID=A0A6B3BMP1_9ACTN|nr:hypothetical protein [Streptomyces sp. SID12501]NEC85306.1 hypothetical protein [Streptomyces sp. SID12501]